LQALAVARQADRLVVEEIRLTPNPAGACFTGVINFLTNHPPPPARLSDLRPVGRNPGINLLPAGSGFLVNFFAKTFRHDFFGKLFL
jgi:hypothetical protein